MIDIDLLFKQTITNVKGFKKTSSRLYYEYNRLFDGHEETLWKHKDHTKIHIRHQLYYRRKSSVQLEGISIKYE